MRHSQSEIAFLEKNGPEHFAKMFSSLKKISHKLAMVDEVLHDNLNPTPLGTKKSNSHHLQLTAPAMTCGKRQVPFFLFSQNTKSTASDKP